MGLPNVGKSTLFNALLKKQQAYIANFPFATIEPNIGVVPVPDKRLEKLADVVAMELLGYKAMKHNSDIASLHHSIPIVPATVEFVDIAGLVAGAHKGEGLGNKFLAHIREVDAIVHVVRAFQDSGIIRAGSVDPKSDLETVKTELDLADLETIEKSKIKKQNAKIQSKNEKSVEDQPFLFRNKPFLVVLNVDEEELKNTNTVEEKFAEENGLEKDQVIAISAKTEADLASLGGEDAKAYLAELGINQSGLERLTQKAFATLGLITFLTAGVKEIRAWTIKNNISAVEASGVIHTDFVKKFIKAEVVPYGTFVECGGWSGSRRSGKTRLEGKDYIMHDGDVVEFKIGS